ncbi:MAG: TonB-dependent receptor plug domain-containing protein, partial [Cellvibrionaceae bacterium]|nr:TonB-dependent receptor plug domain-containing protein [Cellvibrionaceae bacterium]
MSCKTNKPSNTLGAALVSVLSISSPVALAEDKAPANKEIEELKVIGHQQGLMQTKSPTATKMDLSFKDTGRSVTQLAEQQLRDLALENVRQAFDYVAGFRGNGPADRTYTARGVRTSIDNVMVDGLRSLQGGEAGTGSRLPSTFNAESTTFLRGPAGLLYGAGVGGGMINITTKQPEANNRTTLGLKNRSYWTDGSNFESNRSTLELDSTGAIADSGVLYRALAQYTPDGDHFQQGRSIDEQMFDFAMTFELGDSTRLTPRVESTERERSGGSGYADGVFESNFFSGTVNTYGKPVNRSFYYGSSKDKGDNSSLSLSLLLEHQFNKDWDLRLRARSSETESESLDLYISDSSGLGNSIGVDTINRKWVYSKGDDE